MRVGRLVLVRHGRTEWNATTRMQGQLDPDLDDVGRAEAEALAPVVASYGPAVLLASDLRRAWTTAETIGKACGLVPVAEPRLRETDVGRWEGLTGAEVDHGWPGLLERWRHDPTLAPPGGESRHDVAERALPVLRELLAREFDDADGTGRPLTGLGGSGNVATAVIVAHGGTITGTTGAFLGWPSPVWSTLQPLRNCHRTVLEHRFDRWRLAAWGLGVEAPGAG